MVPGTQVRVLAGLPSTSNRRKVQKHQCDAVAMQLRLSGINMIASSDLLAPSNTERKTLEIECESLTVSIERRIQRTVIRGGEGDDLLDEGGYRFATSDRVYAADRSETQVGDDRFDPMRG